MAINAPMVTKISIIASLDFDVLMATLSNRAPIIVTERMAKRIDRMRGILQNIKNVIVIRPPRLTNWTCTRFTIPMEL